MCVGALRRVVVAAVRVLCPVLVMGACGGAHDAEPKAPQDVHGPAVVFSLITTDGSELSSATTRGRVTLLLFLTTYDNASQLMARQFKTIVHHHRPRVNVGAIVLETSKYAVLAPVFKQSLELDYPVAMADEATLRGLGPFGAVHRVPTIIVLDGRGRRVWSQEGFVSPRQVEHVLDLAMGRRDQP